jgi:hypothetical protein
MKTKISEIESAFKEIFEEEEGKVSSVESVYELSENEDFYKLVISVHNLSTADTLIIHTKFIFKTDLKKIKKGLDKHPTLTYYESMCGLKVYLHKDGVELNNGNNGADSVVMDVFICDYYNKITINFCGPLSGGGDPTWWMSELFPNQHIYKNELYPLQEIAFEDTTIMVPNNQINVLYRNFSDQCLSACKISSHTTLHKGFFNSKVYQEGHYMLCKYIDDVDRVFNISKKNSLNMLQCNLAKQILHSNSKLLNNDIIKKILN